MYHDKLCLRNVVELDSTVLIRFLFLSFATHKQSGTVCTHAAIAVFTVFMIDIIISTILIHN